MGILIEPTLQGYYMESRHNKCKLLDAHSWHNKSKFLGVQPTTQANSQEMVIITIILSYLTALGNLALMLTLSFSIHFSPLCSGALWFGSQPTTCTLFFHLCCKVLAFSEVSSTYPILWWPYTFLVFLPLSQELEKFLLEDQIVNILGLWTLQSLSQLHIESWKHSLKTCKWMGMTLLQTKLPCTNKTLYMETGSQKMAQSFSTLPLSSCYSSGIPYLDYSSHSICPPFWTEGYPRAQCPSILACSECSIESGCYSKSPSAENTEWDEHIISILTVKTLLCCREEGTSSIWTLQ